MNGTAAQAEHAQVLVACYAALDGWGGGLTLARGAVDACSRLGLSTRRIGVSRGRASAGPDEAPVRESGRLWRLQPLLTPNLLANWLRVQPTPQLFVAMSPFWVVAARRVWPSVPIAYVYPCLLTNCLPFTLGGRRTWGDWLHLRLVERVERDALRATTRVLVPTHFAAEEIDRFSPQARDRIHRVEFGCVAPRVSPDLRKRMRAQLGAAQQDFLVLLSGVMDRNKAFDFALRELPRCAPRVRLVLAGDGPLRGKLEQLTHELNLGERVIFAGPQRSADPLVAACDLAISTSHYDTYPNALLEALSAGRPIVAPRHEPPHVTAGIGEAILPGGGLLYDRSSPGALAEAVNSFCNDPLLYARHSRAARARGTRMNWSHMAGALGQLLGTQRNAEPVTTALPAKSVPQAAGSGGAMEGAHVE